MLKFACKDCGADCDFVATGATVEEIKAQVSVHAAAEHADEINAMTEAQKAELFRNVEANIRTV